MDFKNFKHFDENFDRQAETCVFCNGSLNMVDLQNSNSQELFVRCENLRCKGYTIAERKQRAKGVLNSLAICLSV